LACAKEKRNAKPKDEETPIVKFGLDVHADQITVCRMLEGSLPQPAQKMSPTKALSWIAGHVKEGFTVKSCYEAGPCGFWLHRALTAKGVDNGNRRACGRPRRCFFEKELAALNAQLEALVIGKLIPKGLGALTTAILEAEVLEWSRFKNRKQVGSFVGLCPSERSSGATRIQGCVNKHGNPRMRHYLAEAVWRLERWQPQYPPLRLLAKSSGSRARKKAAVAIARRLAVDLWRIATGQCSAQKLGLELIVARASH